MPGLLAEWLAGRCRRAPTRGHPAQRHRRQRHVVETLVLDAAWTEDGEPRTGEYVARVAPAAEDVPVFPDYALQDQYDAMRIVGELTDVPVPTVGWIEPTGEVLGTPFFLMDRVDGVVPPDVMPYNFGDNWLFDAVARGPAPAAGRRPSRCSPGCTRSPTPPTTFAFLDPPTTPGATPLARNLARTPRLVRVRGPRHRPLAAGRARARLAGGQPARTTDETRAVLGRLADRQRDVPRLRAGRASSTGRWRRSARASSTCPGWSSPTGSSSPSPTMFEMPGMPHFLREEDVGRRTSELTGVELGDLTGTTSTTRVQWCIVFMRTGARQIHFGEIERPDDIETLFHHKPLLERLLDEVGGVSVSSGIGPLDEYPIHQAPLPVDVGRQQRPQLLRPLLLQRPRPHRRHLPDHRARLLPEPRHQGRLRPGPPRRQADRGAPRPTRSTTTGSTSRSAPTGSRSSSRCSKLRVVLEETEGIAFDLTWDGLVPASSRSSRTSCAPGSRVILDAQRFAQVGTGRARSSSTARRSPSTPDRWVGIARPVVGHPPGRRGRAAGRAGGPAVRGHVVALRPDALRRLRDRA